MDCSRVHPFKVGNRRIPCLKVIGPLTNKRAAPAFLGNNVLGYINLKIWGR